MSGTTLPSPPRPVDPVPFAIIDRAIATGKVIPFLGAGASMELREGDEAWSVGTTNARFGPLAEELAEWLARRATYPHDEQATDLARVAQFAEAIVGRPLLNDVLQQVFSPNLGPTRLHDYLASFEHPLLVITTNYDDRLETAFESAKRPYHLVVQTLRVEGQTMWIKRAGSDQFEAGRDVDVDLDMSASVIYKIHGSRGPQDATDYLISEDDYLQFLQRMMSNRAIPTKLCEPMKNRHFLFIGYGLRDWNFRLLLYQLKEYVEKPTELLLPSWAIMHSVGEVDRRLWLSRRVELFEIPLREFVSGMMAAKDERVGS